MSDETHNIDEIRSELANARRELEIEVALERVRSRTMAMLHSDELQEVSQVVCDQLQVAGIALTSSYVISGFPDDPMNEMWFATSKDSLDRIGKQSVHVQHMAMDGEQSHQVRWREDWKAGKRDNSYHISPDLFDWWLDHFSSFAGAIGLTREFLMETSPKGWYHTDTFTEFGAIGVVLDDPLTNPEKDILARFAKEFERSYRRFEELQASEARTVEARKEASVDRIRGAISTMRTAKDLESITPLMWKELETLEIPFLRCGLLIADEKSQIVRFYPSHSDGRTLAAIELPFGGAGIGDEALNAWRKREVWKDIWDRERFVQWTTEMVKAGQIDNPQDYYDGEVPPESIALHFIPFEQGMIYVGSPDPLTESQLDVVQSLADAFAVAYARYDDFQTTEKALAELKSTQDQLIKQEKLASLGSLTAGIAHEIKNPLNFVNNFAEVSSELVDELRDAVALGDTDEVTSILTDLRGNTEQIAKHGKRADAIVRSMMQHAKGGTSEMETVEFNDFIEEYVNLAWHGMRARDHGFEAEVVRDYDEAIGSLKLKPQDMGRVILNILNNAFQAVSKARVEDAVVMVSTLWREGSIEIHIADNGPGIPEDIREKIFEPFFTTKATGEGTGLGLSLSHDIVTRGHGGTMTVGTSPEGGAEFTVELPAA